METGRGVSVPILVVSEVNTKPRRFMTEEVGAFQKRMGICFSADKHSLFGHVAGRAAAQKAGNNGRTFPSRVPSPTYLAANLIWKPLERVRVGVEYLYGLREDVDGEIGAANRVQAAFFSDLP